MVNILVITKHYETGGGKMQFFLGKQDMRTLQQAQEQSVLLTNGLGGYASVTAAFSVPRCDQGILIAAVRLPTNGSVWYIGCGSVFASGMINASFPASPLQRNPVGKRASVI